MVLEGMFCLLEVCWCCTVNYDARLSNEMKLSDDKKKKEDKNTS